MSARALTRTTVPRSWARRLPERRFVIVIVIEARAAFLLAGGQIFHCIPCLNDSSEGMQAMASVAWRHLQGGKAGLLSTEELTQRQARASTAISGLPMQLGRAAVKPAIRE